MNSCVNEIIIASMDGNEFGLELLNALLINCAEAMQSQHQRLLKTLLAQVCTWVSPLLDCFDAFAHTLKLIFRGCLNYDDRSRSRTVWQSAQWSALVL